MSLAHTQKLSFIRLFVVIYNGFTIRKIKALSCVLNSTMEAFVRDLSWSETLPQITMFTSRLPAFRPDGIFAKYHQTFYSLSRVRQQLINTVVINRSLDCSSDAIQPRAVQSPLFPPRVERPSIVWQLGATSIFPPDTHHLVHHHQTPNSTLPLCPHIIKFSIRGAPQK